LRNIKKSIVVLSCGVGVLSGALCQTARAAIIESGSSTLADVFGTASGPEALTVSWSVDLTAGIYTYDYTVNNPSGNVKLNNNGTPTTTPEVVDAFSVVFNTTAPGAFVPGSQLGGTSQQNNMASGLFWSFVGTTPGNSSPLLSFESLQPPTLGNANAQDANPPSPWASSPYGQQVPIPAPVPEPTTMLFGALLVLPVLRTMKNKLCSS
jgi:hypothetical protein